MWHVVIRIDGFTYRQETTAHVRVTAQRLSLPTEGQHRRSSVSSARAQMLVWHKACMHMEALGSRGKHQTHLFSSDTHTHTHNLFWTILMLFNDINISLQPDSLSHGGSGAQPQTSVVSISPSQCWLWETHNLSLSHSHLWTQWMQETWRQCYPLNHRADPSTSCSRLCCWQLPGCSTALQ